MQSLKVSRIYGIDIYLHPSWWLIFILLSYSLSIGFFPQNYPNQTSWMYWLMALISAILLFLSVLFHELSHSLVAKTNKIKVDKIVLFFFGGVASLPTEEIKPKTELAMAAAGPLFSLCLAGLFYLTLLFSLPTFFEAIFSYLWQLNLVVGLFNLVPGYPLDGGRIFRSILMFYYKDIRKATKIAAGAGKLFAYMLILFGTLGIFSGLVQGLWFVLIGSFIYFAARNSYESILIKECLSKIKILDIMEKIYPKIKPHDSLQNVSEIYSKSSETSFVVQKKGRFLGMVDAEKLSSAVLASLIPAESINAPKLSSTAYDALRVMDDNSLDVVPVIKNSKVFGIVKRTRIIHMLNIWRKNE